MASQAAAVLRVIGRKRREKRQTSQPQQVHLQTVTAPKENNELDGSQVHLHKHVPLFLINACAFLVDLTLFPVQFVL